MILNSISETPRSLFSQTTVVLYLRVYKIAGLYGLTNSGMQQLSETHPRDYLKTVIE